MLDKINQKYINIIIVVLVVAAVGLGYIIYKEDTSSSAPANQQQQNQVQQNQPQAGDSQQAPTITPEDIEIEDMEQARQEVLSTPGPNAPDEERQRHFALATRLAENSETLDITGCSAEPVVLQRTFGSTINIENSDSSSHTILFGPDMTIDVPANGTADLAVDESNFQNGPGLYGYGCDNSSQAVGLMLISPDNQQQQE